MAFGIAVALNLACQAATSREASARPNSKDAYTWRNVEIGGGGGFVDGIVFSPIEPNLIYARTDIGGVYRWDEGSKRWVPLTDWVGQEDGNLRGAESIAVDPTDADRVYIAAGTYSQRGQKTAILRSSDRGRTWKRTPMPLLMGGNEHGRSIGERLAVDPNRPSILYFGSRHDGLWRSADYGATWSQVTSFPQIPDNPPQQAGQWRAARSAGVGWVIFDGHSSTAGQPSRTIYAGVASVDAPGLYRSTDSGATWQAVAGQPTRLMPHHAALDSIGALYLTYSDALGPNGITNGAIYRLDTHSGSWRDITPLKPTAGHGGGYAGLSIDPAHPGTVVVSTLDFWNPGDDIFRTTDAGAYWVSSRATAVLNPAGAPWLKWGALKPKFGWWTGDVAIDPFHPSRVLYGTGATIWGTDDITPAASGRTTHWKMYAAGIEETAVTALISPPIEAHLISGLGDIGGFTHRDLAISPPEGMSNPPIFGSTSGLDFAELSPSVVVRVGSSSTQHGAYSADGGRTWAPFLSEPRGLRGAGSVAVTADGKRIVWAASGAPISYSSDLGSSWTVCGGLPGAGSDERQSYFGQGRWSVVSDRADPRTVYATDGSGALYVSADSGADFTRAAAAGFPSGKGVLHAVPGRAGDIWYSTGDAGLFHSVDSGASFAALTGIEVSDGLGFGKAAPNKSYPAMYLVGTPLGAAHGVYRSDDVGKTWVRINDDRHQYGWIGEPVTGDPRVYGRVYVGTNGRGIVYGDLRHVGSSD